MKRYQTILWIVLLLTISLSIWVVSNPEESNLPDKSSATQRQSKDLETPHQRKIMPNTETQLTHAPAKVLNSLMPRHFTGLQRKDLFTAYSWDPPKQVIKETPSPPSPPTLPFTYLGRLTHDRQPKVILLANEQIHVVQIGDEINQTYRVEQIQAQRISLNYLPMGITQHLHIPNISTN